MSSVPERLTNCATEQVSLRSIHHGSSSIRRSPGTWKRPNKPCQLWIQAYPRAALPHIYLAGAIYPDIAQYEKAVEQGREAVRLSPNFSPSYYVPIRDYISLNRMDEAKAAYEQALERKLKSSFFHLALYQIAFLQNDSAGMAQQVSSSAGKPGLEATLLANEADTAAYSGRLSTAREFSRQAVDSAERAGDKEAAATYSALSALREALVRQCRRSKAACHFGNEASRRATICSMLRRLPGPMPGKTSERKNLPTIWARGSRKPQSCSSITCQPSAQSLRSTREMLLKPWRLSEPPCRMS